jgi:LytS/YehU family sensor histidine kinase
MRNINQRLALLYGEAATHAVDDSGSRYRVTLTLPIERAA